MMPIQAFPGASSWGYNPVFYFAPAEVEQRSAELLAQEAAICAALPLRAALH